MPLREMPILCSQREHRTLNPCDDPAREHVTRNLVRRLLGRKAMLCPNCHAAYSTNDLYCRNCGADLAAPSTSLVPARTRLPAVFSNPQLPRVAAGVGALAVGAGLELLRRGLLARLTRSSRSVADTLPAIDGIRNLLPSH